MTERPLRIGMIADTFPATSETFVSSQVLGLVRLGHHVQVLAERRPASGEPSHRDEVELALPRPVTYVDLPPEVEAGLTVWPLNAWSWPPGSSQPLRNHHRVARALPALARSAVGAPLLTRELLSSRRFGVDASSLATIYRADAARRVSGPVDVAHAHFGPVANNFRFVSRLWRAPLVVTFHGYDFSAWPQQHGRDCYSALFASASAVMVNSQHARARLRDLGCPPHLLHRLNVGVDLQRYTFRRRTWLPGETLRLLTVGRLTDKKGHDKALRAVARLLRSRNDRVQYDIVGDGPLRTQLHDLVRELGLQGVVRLRGAQPPDEVRRLMDEAHVFLLASRKAANGDEEGTPVVLLEAQASGLPVVSTDHAGIPEIARDGVVGRLVAEGDETALAQALCELIERPELWPTMGANGRAHVRARHDAAKLLGELVELYRSVGDSTDFMRADRSAARGMV